MRRITCDAAIGPDEVRRAGEESFIGNGQFLKSMIPHHSRAILVCERSDITDPEIIELCGQIVETQQEEIDQMKQILQRYL
ncbi:DUF305 domain-containing protein [Solwaraspora sp. WMMA2059]|uniref:DUF305 domain-containing protein n=1 Tax=Solwaraspora sp. WMMA2059 TaxID=3015160 RepID=UPI00248ABAB0|nr:DUF305 domain-containing protein [Solwaraspora sp. WMMA2059]WBB94870.1 DUF305 domain-containing protein [Solwaraspora sp. WMMA2059]